MLYFADFFSPFLHLQLITTSCSSAITVTSYQVFSQTTAFPNICLRHALSTKEEVTREQLRLISERISLAEDRWRKVGTRS